MTGLSDGVDLLLPFVLLLRVLLVMVKLVVVYGFVKMENVLVDL
jgi:hypothetical protein